MLDKALVSEKLAAIAVYLKELEPILKSPYKHFYKNYLKARTAERDFQLIVDNALDINIHLILAKNRKPPEKNFEAFLELGEVGIIPSKFARALAPSAGLRNKLVHEYEKIDPYILYKSLQKFAPLYRRYSKVIYELIKKFR